MPAPRPAVLAKQLKVSRGTVQNRLERLQAAGTLLGYTIRLGDTDDAPGGCAR